MPCFLCGGQENTIPYDLRRLNKPDMGLMADSAPGKGDGSRVYEINMWLWQFGRGMPRSLSVAEAQQRRDEDARIRTSRGAETRKRRAADLREGRKGRARLGSRGQDAEPL